MLNRFLALVARSLVSRGLRLRTTRTAHGNKRNKILTWLPEKEDDAHQGVTSEHDEDNLL